jgi:hypothetical protein
MSTRQLWVLLAVAEGTVQPDPLLDNSYLLRGRSVSRTLSLLVLRRLVQLNPLLPSPPRLTRRGQDALHSLGGVPDLDVSEDNAPVSCDPIKTIVSAIRRVRPDWQPDDIAALFDRSDIPRETLLSALVTGCQSVDRDGTYLLARPGDVLRGTWLVSAQADVDQLIARDRDAHGGKPTSRRSF